jgi:hypothetical protein
LVGVEINYNCGTTLYAQSKNEEVGVCKKQGSGTTYHGKGGKGIVDPTHQCGSTYL